jgi:hypothetical protein
MYACSQARQTSWSQRRRERRRRDSLATYWDTPTRTVNLPRVEDDGHQHAPLLLRDSVPEPATPANMTLGNACLRPGLIGSNLD